MHIYMKIVVGAFAMAAGYSPASALTLTKAQCVSFGGTYVSKGFPPGKGACIFKGNAIMGGPRTPESGGGEQLTMDQCKKLGGYWNSGTGSINPATCVFNTSGLSSDIPVKAAN